MFWFLFKTGRGHFRATYLDRNYVQIGSHRRRAILGLHLSDVNFWMDGEEMWN